MTVSGQWPGTYTSDSHALWLVGKSLERLFGDSVWLGPDSIIVAYVCIILYIYRYIDAFLNMQLYCIYIYICVCVCVSSKSLYILSNLCFLFPGSFAWVFPRLWPQVFSRILGSRHFPKKDTPAMPKMEKCTRPEKKWRNILKYHPMKPYYLVVDLFWYSCWIIEARSPLLWVFNVKGIFFLFRLPESPSSWGDDTLGHGASVCSTFLATDRDGVSTMGENTMSLRLGDEGMLWKLVDV